MRNSTGLFLVATIHINGNTVSKTQRKASEKLYGFLRAFFISKETPQQNGDRRKRDIEQKWVQASCAAYIGIGGMKIEDEPRH